MSIPAIVANKCHKGGQVAIHKGTVRQTLKDPTISTRQGLQESKRKCSASLQTVLPATSSSLVAMSTWKTAIRQEIRSPPTAKVTL
jgi:hypothetical protein